MLPNIAGPIDIRAGNITLNKGLVSTGASSGILVKSKGTIATAAGTNTTTGATSFSTAGGPITFWAGSDGSGNIDIANFNKFDSNSAGTTGGGDITFGGNTTAAAGNANKPAGPVVAPSGIAVELGSSLTQNNGVQIYADGGALYIGGKTASTSASGVEYFPGLTINAGTVEIYGETATATTVNNTASGVFAAAYSTRNDSVSGTITATDSFMQPTDAI